jgi:hypothetical protein
MKRTLTALALIATTAFAAPAVAGGFLSFEVNPTNADEANAIRSGLTLYQVVQDIEANGSITQNGLNNLAALGQNGSGNVGVIHQEGNDHDASLSQNGNGNAYGIFQVGNGTSGQVNQSGNGGTGLLFQIGFD